MKMEIEYNASRLGSWSQHRFEQVSNSIVPCNDGNVVKITEPLVTILQCCNRIKESTKEPGKFFLITAENQMFHNNVIEITENSECEMAEFTINNGDRVTVKFEKMLTHNF